MPQEETSSRGMQVLSPWSWQFASQQHLRPVPTKTAALQVASTPPE